MRAPDGRAYAAPNQGNLNRTVQRNLEELDRRTMRQQKPQKVTAGGPVGIVDVLSTNGTVIPRETGLELALENVTYQAPSTKAGDGSWLSTSAHELVFADEGWYHPVMQVVIGWAEASHPDYVDVFMGDGPDLAHTDGDMMPTFKSGTSWGVYRFVDHGPTFLAAGGRLHAEVQWGPATSGAFTSFGGGARINWTITRLA